MCLICVNFVKLSCRTSEHHCALASKFEFDFNYISNNCVLYRRRRREDSEDPSSVGSGGSGTSTGSLPSPPRYCIVCDLLVLYICDCTQPYATQYFPSLRCILDGQCLLNGRRVFEVRTRFRSRARAVFLIGYSQNAELQKRQFLVRWRPHVMFQHTSSVSYSCKISMFTCLAFTENALHYCTVMFFMLLLKYSQSLWVTTKFHYYNVVSFFNYGRRIWRRDE